MSNKDIQAILQAAHDNDWHILPGFCDVHVHFREPGFSYKETIATGIAAAVRGGYTAVCPMPNVNPVPDAPATLKEQLDRIKQHASIACIPYGSITKGERGKELSEMAAIAPDVIAFSDDGRGVQSDEVLEEAMICAQKLGRLIVQHCEDETLSNHGYIHDGHYAKAHGHTGIPSESEWKQLERDLALAKKTGCAYHACHISTKESVELIKQAKADGVDATCEVMPHNLLLDESCLKEDGRFKINPPIRSKVDQEALLQGVIDGTIDIIATDHAPHSAEEKSKGLAKSAFGAVGLEIIFPLLYTRLVKEHIITLERLVECMSANPRKRFNIQTDVGHSIWDLRDGYTINPEEFLSKGRATPFAHEYVYGRNMATLYKETMVYQDPRLNL